jgi:hypothetical protein
MNPEYIEILKKILVVITLAYVIGITTLSYHANHSTGTLFLGVLLGLYYIGLVLKEDSQ